MYEFLRFPAAVALRRGTSAAFHIIPLWFICSRHDLCFLDRVEARTAVVLSRDKNDTVPHIDILVLR